MNHKVGRNDPCPCGSGKKFKKCCEEKTRHKKFQAEILSTPEAPHKISSLFQRSHAHHPHPVPAEEEKNTNM